MLSYNNNIVGVGTDIVSIQRVRYILDSYPQRFPRRILHPRELVDFENIHSIRDKSAFIARRFVAKEAVAKSLGYGFTNGIYAGTICIVHNSYGQPQVILESPFAIYQVLISIADEREYAVAYAITIKGN